MKLLVVVTPPFIYHGCSTQKTFWEEKFTGKEIVFLAVDMKNCGRRNVRKQKDTRGSEKYVILKKNKKIRGSDKYVTLKKHKEIRASDKYVTLDISSKFESLDKTKITSLESKVKL